MYKVDSLRSSLGPALALLAETALQPAFTPEDIEEARQVIQFQRLEAAGQPEVLVSELLYAAAYGRDSPLGRLDKCPEERVGAVTGATLRSYAGKYFTSSRMVLSAVGVDHDELVRHAEKLFAGVPSTPHPAALAARPSASGAEAYVGGLVTANPDWEALPHTVSGAAAKREFTHFMLAFPSVGWAHDDVVPVCVVDTLLGGGSSFSAGGPGKGMYSRLYRELLNAHSWVESANAFSAQLYDCGLLGIYGACPPQHAGALVRLAATHLARLVDVPVLHGELARARNQLASSVMMNLEQRGLLAEDIGRQVLSHGKRLDPAELVRRIQAVTPADISRVMRSALAHPPAFAAVGEADTLLPYDRICGFFDNARAGSMSAMSRVPVVRMTGADAAGAAAARSPAGSHADRLFAQAAAAASSATAGASAGKSGSRSLHTSVSNSSLSPAQSFGALSAAAALARSPAAGLQMPTGAGLDPSAWKAGDALIRREMQLDTSVAVR